MIDTLILGDNAFFGINHRSQSHGEERARHFQDVRNIIHVFRAARESGAHGVMLSAHASVREIVQAMLEDPDLSDDFSVYPNIPYLLKYVSEVTRHGMLGALMHIMRGQSGLENLRHVALGSLGILKRDFYQWARVGLDVEMSQYKNARIPAVFLHNGIVDLLLGLRMKEPFLFFDEYVRERYSAEPGYGTLNLPALVYWLKECGLSKPLVMAPFNAAGFHMNPSKELAEKVVREEEFTLLAMNVLVSGALGPRDALTYLGSFNTIRHVVLGASTPSHISESFRLAKECLPR